MPLNPDRQRLVLTCFWLVVGALALLAIAGIILPKPVDSRNHQVELLQPVVVRPGEPGELVIRLDPDIQGLKASLSYDIGNRIANIGSLDLPGNLENVLLDPKRKIAYLANSFSGLQIIDTSEPDNPKLVGGLDIPGNAWDMIIRDETLFVAAAKGGLQIVDVSRPRAPRIISNLSLPGRPLLKLALHGNAVYATNGRRGLTVIDIGDIDRPRLVRTLNDDDGNWGAAVHGEFLYTSCGLDRLDIYGLADPENPIRVSSLTIPGKVWEMGFDSNFLYLPTREAGLVAVDITRPDRPVGLKPAHAGQEVETIKIRDGLAYMTSRGGTLVVADISEPGIPMHFRQVDLSVVPRNLAIDGEYVLVACNIYGLRVYDLGTLFQKQETVSLNVPGNMQRFIVRDRTYFMAANNFGLFIARHLGNDTIPTMIASLPLSGKLQNMVLVDDRLYLASTEADLQIVDVSDPAKPVFLGRQSLPGQIFDIATDDRYLYLSSMSVGLLVLDLANRDAPALVGQLPLPEPRRMVLRRNRLYIASLDTGFHIIDISDPTAPADIGHTTLPWPISQFARPHQLCLSGRVAFLAAGVSDLVLFDISDERNPTIGKIVQVDGDPHGVAIEDDRVYVTTREGKLFIYTIDGAATLNCVAAMDTLGSSHNIVLSGETVIVANTVKGLLSFLPLPHLLDTNEAEKVFLRSRSTTSLHIGIPPLKTPGIYNLTLIHDGILKEYIGAVRVVPDSE